MKDPVCDERAQELILKLKEEGLVISDVTPPQEHISGKYEDYGRCFEVKDIYYFSCITLGKNYMRGSEDLRVTLQKS